jgi:hypothetical protein
LVTVPPGPHILSDILISSPIISEEGGAGAAFAAAGGGAGGAASEFGFVDPNLDPELAMVCHQYFSSNSPSITTPLVVLLGYQIVYGRRKGSSRG